MFRFLSHLLGKPYESCKGCEVLKEQLSIANTEKSQMLDTILGFVQPKAVQQPVRELEPIQPKSMIWSRRKQLLEEQDREAARRIKADKNLGKPDNEYDKASAHAIEELENELGIKEESIASEVR